MRSLRTASRIIRWLTVAVAAAWLGLSDVPRERGLPPHVLVLRDRTYRVAGGREVRLDVHLPRERPDASVSNPLRPGALLIHGGSWVGGSKSDYALQFGRMLDAGYVLFAADYKLARPGDPGWPEALDDLREAVRWVRRHAGEFQVDPNRLAAIGSGAGGHLALLLGTARETLSPDDVPPRVQAVVSLYGPTDLDDLVRHRRLVHDPVRTFLGDSPAESGLASPIRQVSGESAPALLIHGTEDAWVPVEQARRLARAFSAAGVRHRLIEIPGARHGFELEVRYPEARDLLPDLTAFLTGE